MPSFWNRWNDNLLSADDFLQLFFRKVAFVIKENWSSGVYIAVSSFYHIPASESLSDLLKYFNEGNWIVLNIQTFLLR